MEATIEMTAERYGELIRAIANLKDVCNDAEINGSMIRQRTNDKNSIFEMNLKPIFDNQEVDISLVTLKQKFELLKIFQSSKDGVRFEITDDEYTISDGITSLRFLNTPQNYLDNQFIPETDLENIFNASEDDLIFMKELDSIITDRIAVVVQQFSIISLQIVFEEDKASINSAAQSKDQWASFIKDIETNMVFQKTVANISKDPFVIDHDSNIVFSMYKVPDRDMALNLFTTNLGTVDVKIYSRAGLHEDTE